MTEPPVKRHLDGIYIRVMRGDQYLTLCLTDCTWDEVERHLIETVREQIDGGKCYLLGTISHLHERLRAAGDTNNLAGRDPDAPHEPGPA